VEDYRQVQLKLIDLNWDGEEHSPYNSTKNAGPTSFPKKRICDLEDLDNIAILSTN
jgi:hypothetical protein